MAGKLKKYLNNPFFFSVVLNAAALLVSVYIFKPFFEENDDAFISMIAEGAYGTREVHLIYANVILGSIYNSLYASFPGIRWHSVFQYAFLFIAFTALTCVLQLMRQRRLGDDSTPISGGEFRAIAALLVLSTLYEVYVSVQYSKTAATICAIGYILLLYGAGTRAGNGRAVKRTALNLIEATGILLLIYGMLLRDSSFLLASLLVIPVGLYEFLHVMKNKFDKKAFRIFVFTFAPVLIWFIATKVVNTRAYAADEDWKSFMEYNDIRMQFQDYRYDLLDYNKYGSRLDSLGISENDSLLYLTWQFGDDTVIGMEKMREVLTGAPGRWTLTECIKALAQHIYEDVLIFNPLVLGTLFFAASAFAVIIRNRDRGRFAALVSQLIVFCGILVYYEYCGRWNHRIVFAAMLVFAVSAAWLYTSAETDFSVKAGPQLPQGNTEGPELQGNTAVPVLQASYTYAAVLIAVSCFAVLLGNRLDYNRYKREMPDYKGFFESMGNDKETLYIADTFTFQYAYRYDVFTPYREGSLDNFAAVGSWFVNSPLTRNITMKYGYYNPVRALAGVKGDKEATADGDSSDSGTPDTGTRVLLVDNMYPDEKLIYLKEHYGERSLELYSDGFGLDQYLIQ